MSELTKKPKHEAVVFREAAANAGRKLVDWVGEERAKEATGRISAALAAAAASARDPSMFYECTTPSIATVVAISALTGIMPSTGAGALAYAIPRRPRRNEQPQLQYSLSHRGLNALARRSGQTMLAIPVSERDELSTTNGETALVNQDIDNPPRDYDDLRGVILVVKELASGRVTFSGFVAKAVIDKRRAKSAAGNAGPWKDWPVEMASKTAMHYAAARGWCVIDDTAAKRALSVDIEMDTTPEKFVDTTARPSLEDLGDVATGATLQTQAERAALTVEPEPEPASKPEAEPDGDSVANILLDRLDDVTDAAQLAKIGKAIGEAELTAAELKEISTRFDEIEAALAAS